MTFNRVVCATNKGNSQPKRYFIAKEDDRPTPDGWRSSAFITLSVTTSLSCVLRINNLFRRAYIGLKRRWRGATRHSPNKILLLACWQFNDWANTSNTRLFFAETNPKTIHLHVRKYIHSLDYVRRCIYIDNFFASESQNGAQMKAYIVRSGRFSAENKIRGEIYDYE